MGDITNGWVERDPTAEGPVVEETASTVSTQPFQASPQEKDDN